MTAKENLIEFIKAMTDEEASIILHKVPLFEKRKAEETEETPAPFRDVVYCIRHNKTGKEYIGRTGKYPRRIKEHFAHLRKGNHPVEDMQTDYDKYGEDYTVTVIGEITDRWDINTEFKLMYEHGSYIRGKGYNYKDRCFPRWKKWRRK